MRGSIDENGRALITVSIAPNPRAPRVPLEVWIDTGFTGDLVVPRSTIDALALSKSGSVDAILADGSQIEVNTYTCIVNWFGEDRRLEVIANHGDYPLLGIGLLLGLEMRANYHTMELELNVPHESPTM